MVEITQDEMVVVKYHARNLSEAAQAAIWSEHYGADPRHSTHRRMIKSSLADLAATMGFDLVPRIKAQEAAALIETHETSAGTVVVPITTRTGFDGRMK
jgi:hypothetical protein